MKTTNKICRQIVLGYDAKGKQIRKRVYANSQRELERKILEVRNEHEKVRNPSNVTFYHYATRWLEVYKAGRQLNTRKMYQYALNQCEELYHIPIREITKTDLQAVLMQYADRPRFAQQIKLTLKQIFNAAMDDGHIPANPAARLEVPKYVPKERRSLTDEERQKIKDAQLPDAERLFLDLVYYFGLRRGETLALRGSDFDFKSLLLTIDKSIAFDGNRPILKTEKRDTVRQVPIPEEFVRPLPKGELFPGMTASRYRGLWANIQKEIGEELTAHMIRHDYATRLYYVPGISPKKKAEILGHSERLFLELYSHIDEQREAMEAFQASMVF